MLEGEIEGRYECGQGREEEEEEKEVRVDEGGRGEECV